MIRGRSFILQYQNISAFNIELLCYHDSLQIIQDLLELVIGINVDANERKRDLWFVLAVPCLLL